MKLFITGQLENLYGNFENIEQYTFKIFQKYIKLPFLFPKKKKKKS